MNSGMQPIIKLPDVRFIGQGLVRPESVLVTADEQIFVADYECGVVRIGGRRTVLREKPEGFVPNGVALTPQGEFIIANPGGCGGVWRLDPDHRLHPFLLELDGVALANCNSVEIDHAGRTWISVCTRRYPRDQAFNAQTRDGFIVLIDQDGKRIVADDIGFTNECRIDPTGSYLYVNETFGRRLTRFRLQKRNGLLSLCERQTIHEFSEGDFPDGLAFDAQNGVWVACIVSNRIVRIATDGRAEVVLDDSDPMLTTSAESRFREGRFERKDIEQGATRTLCNVSSIAFGGPDLRTVYLGNLGGDRIATFRSPLPGARPAHWDHDVSPDAYR
jgi:sugar lactone lactonase YvrE